MINNHMVVFNVHMIIIGLNICIFYSIYKPEQTVIIASGNAEFKY